MRIITGEFRGRRLQSPKTYDVRPTSDKVKEAIFSMLMPYLNEESVVCDLFAGTGNMGLEALSRGAARCYFSDSSRDSLKLVKENIAVCRAEDRSILLSGDYKLNLGRIHEKLDIVFLDPPYADKYILPAIEIIVKNDLLNEGGCIVCEHSDSDELPESYMGLNLVKNRRYGSIGVSIYE